MNPALRAWLLEGEPLPDDVDLEAALAGDPDAAALAAELDAIDAAAAQLPMFQPPAHLVASVLAAVAQTPQDAPVGMHSLGQLPAAPVRPARQTWFKWASLGLAAAAAALLVVQVIPSTAEPVGDPANWTARGIDESSGPGVQLRMVVDHGNGSVERLNRGSAYGAGDVLLFRYDTRPDAWLHLVRVDDRGAELVHAERASDASGHLQTSGHFFGYELEAGEGAAVYALVSHNDELSNRAIASILSVGPDVRRVCAAAQAELRARCSAERVEAVR